MKKLLLVSLFLGACTSAVTETSVTRPEEGSGMGQDPGSQIKASLSINGETWDLSGQASPVDTFSTLDVMEGAEKTLRLQVKHTTPSVYLVQQIDPTKAPMAFTVNGESWKYVSGDTQLSTKNQEASVILEGQYENDAGDTQSVLLTYQGRLGTKCFALIDGQHVGGETAEATPFCQGVAQTYGQ